MKASSGVGKFIFPKEPREKLGLLWSAAPIILILCLFISLLLRPSTTMYYKDWYLVYEHLISQKIKSGAKVVILGGSTAVWWWSGTLSIFSCSFSLWLWAFSPCPETGSPVDLFAVSSSSVLSLTANAFWTDSPLKSSCAYNCATCFKEQLSGKLDWVFNLLLGIRPLLYSSWLLLSFGCFWRLGQELHTYRQQEVACLERFRFWGAT